MSAAAGGWSSDSEDDLRLSQEIEEVEQACEVRTTSSDEEIIVECDPQHYWWINVLRKAAPRIYLFSECHLFDSLPMCMYVHGNLFSNL